MAVSLREFPGLYRRKQGFLKNKDETDLKLPRGAACCNLMGFRMDEQVA